MVNRDRFNQVISDIVAAARMKAVAMCNQGSLGRLPKAGYVKPADVVALVSVSLLETLIFRSEEKYVAENGRNVPVACMKGVTRAIERAGEVEFNGYFSKTWMTAERELKGSNARIKLAQVSDAESYHNRILLLCVDWAIKSLSCGVMPQNFVDNSELYRSVVSDYEDFCRDAGLAVDFSEMPCLSGIESFDLEHIPCCEVSYDVFISYRRVDGDVGARLINQELEHRGCKCFLDVEQIGNGAYNPQILSALREANNFVFVLTPQSIVGLDNPDDPVRIELELARKWAKNIVMIAMPRMPRNIADKSFPPSLDFLRELNIYRLDVGENFEASMDRIMGRGLRSPT